MTDDTPDRAALAKRLKPLAFGADAACNSCWCDIGPHRGCPIKAAYRALSAAPAPEPPSVVEAKHALDVAIVKHRIAEHGYQRKAVTLKQFNAAHDAIGVAQDALIAAVRAETVAEAVRAVEALPRYVLHLNLRQGSTAPNMEPAANGAWVGQTEALAALRALGGQP